MSSLRSEFPQTFLLTLSGLPPNYWKSYPSISTKILRWTEEIWKTSRTCLSYCSFNSRDLKPSLLFNLFMNTVLNALSTFPGFSINYTVPPVPVLAYADDLALLSHSKEELQAMMVTLEDALQLHCMQINTTKTHIMTVAPRRSAVGFNPIPWCYQIWMHQYQLFTEKIGKLQPDYATNFKSTLPLSTKFQNEIR